ncbi:hypothetical protein FA09DRAFT_340925 [Tilletiopsis washingtonensis]|uniref:Uncharacterized protein n=1 Tax=Tilletiopsis washingtonensis TaxID=58919 RepID=A0A316Z2J7_9BASI|nr:hypothetical protein FA09DRAFT_340925 [Tilletiopsis washingtonensis]PWN95596.1 hypothetical protein FA09DRAFT_340925 [Tilletiopsis washingtonensis]
MASSSSSSSFPKLSSFSLSSPVTAGESSSAPFCLAPAPLGRLRRRASSTASSVDSQATLVASLLPPPRRTPRAKVSCEERLSAPLAPVQPLAPRQPHAEEALALAVDEFFGIERPERAAARRAAKDERRARKEQARREREAARSTIAARLRDAGWTLKW